MTTSKQAHKDKQSATAHLVVIKHNTPAENQATPDPRTPPTPRQQQLTIEETCRTTTSKACSPQDLACTSGFQRPSGVTPFPCACRQKPGPSLLEVRGCHCHEFGAPKAGEHLVLVEATLLATAEALAPPRLYWVWKHQTLAVSSPGCKGLAERLIRWLGAPRAVPCPGAPGLAVAAPGLAHQAVRGALVWDGSVRTKCTSLQPGKRCRRLLR